jgi:hypothetical protein
VPDIFDIRKKSAFFKIADKSRYFSGFETHWVLQTSAFSGCALFWDMVWYDICLNKF